MKSVEEARRAYELALAVFDTLDVEGAPFYIPLRAHVVLVRAQVEYIEALQREAPKGI